MPVQKKTRRRRDGTIRTWWEARYIDPAGQRRSKNFDRKRDADDWLEEQTARLRRGEWVNPDAGKITLAAWWARWLPSKRRLGPKTKAGYESLWHTWIEPELGHRRLSTLRRVDVEGLVSGVMAAGRSPSRARQVHTLVSQLLAAAVDNQLTIRNPATGIELPAPNTRERRYLTAGQVDLLADTIDRRYRAWVYVTTYGGLRFSETVGLRRRHVDVLRRRLLIAESQTEVGGVLHQVDTKGHQAKPVRLPRFVADELATHLECIPDDPDARVFTAPAGGLLRYSNFRRRIWDDAVTAAGLEGVTPHELRHTCAALLIAAGAHPKEIQEQMRHSSIAVTFDVYGHLFDDNLDGLFDRVEELREQGRNQVVDLDARRESDL